MLLILCKNVTLQLINNLQIEEVIIIKEYLLSVNKFERPKELNEKESMYLLIRRLIILTPGSVQSHPKMGVGLISKWRYSYIENIDLLKHEIENQIQTYLPTLQGVDVEITQSDIVDKEIYINISANNTLYRFTTNDNTLQLRDLRRN